MADAGGAPATRCYRHPGREALIRCVRCDRPICPECMRPASVGFHCPDDARAGARSIRAPRTSLGATLRQTRPWVTITLIALNVAVYVVTGLQAHASLSNPRNSALFLDWQLSPYAIHAHHDYYQLLTSAFLHLSPLHIAANMLTLALVGPVLEQQLGRRRYLAVYLLSALGGSAAVYAFGDRFGYTAGASGAIFGLFGVALVLLRRIGLEPQWLVGTIVLNFVITFSVPDISQQGHVGGFVTGALAGVALAGVPTPATNWRGHRIDAGRQAVGLGVLLVLVAVVVAVRSATW